MLKGAGVVLCTYNHSAALKLVGEGLKFDLIVLDEASQVAETLTLVPLMCMGPRSRLVLAGVSKEDSFHLDSDRDPIHEQYTSCMK